ncbi:MAG: hypothetical protein QXZ70_06680 [Candidatus Bathyarchaeia archaeon]
MSIEKTYELIKKNIPQVPIDPFEVVRQVEEYRLFWKPNKTKVVLLAESHVYTDTKDYKIKCKEIIPGYPVHYVRFVYCLGYGENDLLERKIENNTGTPQFWKIFSSCVASNIYDLGFNKVLKTKTPIFQQRLQNKIGILYKMQRKGIWLLDASIVGLYRSGVKNFEETRRIIEISWDNHIANVIKELEPKFIIIIGKKVENILGSKLKSFATPYKTMPQPQARVNSQEQLERFKEYQRICAKYC